MTDNARQNLLRQIPAVERLLQHPTVSRWIEATSRDFVVREIQALLRTLRQSVLSGEPPAPDLSLDGLSVRLTSRLSEALRPILRPVVNATGVVLHTNLGRAPQSTASQEALSAVSAGYTNLEFDLSTGDRWHRDKVLEELLTGLLGCEASTVVNNNAAAVFLILNTLAQGREVIVSRGELIEIGGSFRIPDIMARSGAILREVGTTNKTRLADFEEAIGENTALLLRVHPSNYRIRGFTERPGLEETVDLARRRNVPLYEDLGSGCLLDLRPFGIQEEPVAQESLASGVHLVSFSADKLLGGPQAGIVAGSRELVTALRRNPLMRAFRVEKLIYGALEATLRSYRTGRAIAEIPVLRMLAISEAELQGRAEQFAARLRSSIPEGLRAEVIPGRSVVGGGSCPDTTLPTWLVALASDSPTPSAMERRLRSGSPPIVVRLEEDRLLVDLRTVFPAEEDILLRGLQSAFRH